MKTQPQVAFRNCDFCQKYWHDEDTGEPREIPKDSGLYMLRPQGTLPPCRMPKECGGGCPKGTPENQLSLTPQNMQAYRHYKTCQAVGRFPEDEIVEINAGIIFEAEQMIEANKWAEFRNSILTAALRNGVG